MASFVEKYYAAKKKAETEKQAKEISEKIEVTISRRRTPNKTIIASLMNEVLCCPDCGMEIVPTTARYCWNCGTEIEKRYRREIGNNIVVTLPLNKDIKSVLNKIAMEELKEIDEYSGGIEIQDFCDTLIEKGLASAALCKKLGAVSAKIGNYYDAIEYYNRAMEIDSRLDLWSQIERLEKKLEKEY